VPGKTLRKSKEPRGEKETTRYDLKTPDIPVKTGNYEYAMLVRTGRINSEMERVGKHGCRWSSKEKNPRDEGCWIKAGKKKKGKRATGAGGRADEGIGRKSSFCWSQRERSVRI